MAYIKYQEELKRKIQDGELPFENILDAKFAYRYVKINTTPTIKPKPEKCTENAQTGTFAVGRMGDVFVCAGEPVEWKALKFVEDEAN